MKCAGLILILCSFGCDGSPRVPYTQALQDTINKYPELNGCVAVYVQSRDAYDIDMTVIRCNNSTTITESSHLNSHTAIVDDHSEEKK